MTSFRGKVKTIIHELSLGKCSSCKHCWWVLSEQTGNGLNHLKLIWKEYGVNILKKFPLLPDVYYRRFHWYIFRKSIFGSTSRRGGICSAGFLSGYKGRWIFLNTETYFFGTLFGAKERIIEIKELLKPMSSKPCLCISKCHKRLQKDHSFFLKEYPGKQNFFRQWVRSGVGYWPNCSSEKPLCIEVFFSCVFIFVNLIIREVMTYQVVINSSSSYVCNRIKFHLQENFIFLHLEH